MLFSQQPWTKSLKLFLEISVVGKYKNSLEISLSDQKRTATGFNPLLVNCWGTNLVISKYQNNFLEKKLAKNVWNRKSKHQHFTYLK